LLGCRNPRHDLPRDELTRDYLHTDHLRSRVPCEYFGDYTFKCCHTHLDGTHDYFANAISN
jgi:hypothetical protein